MNKRQLKKLLKIGKGNVYITIAILLCVSLFTLYQKNQPLSSDVVTLSKCTDGDTANFNINGKSTKVRFLGIDSPETVKPNTPEQPFGKEASNYTCNALTQAEEIRIEYEESNKTDKYGRLLGWIFVDDVLLQEELVKQGLAEVKYLEDKYKYTAELKQAEKEAKSNKLGIWSN